MRTCERCKATPSGEYELHDYCAHCSKNLCGSCMEKGCCGHVPALSGMEADHGEEATSSQRKIEEERSDDERVAPGADVSLTPKITALL